jgi:alpha-glucosidase (family GH31 glycosyl hydrolase)
MEKYMMRNVQWAALHSSMGMGEPPWSFKPEVADVMLQSAKLHARIAPYLYSNARRTFNDGYPWTMTPLSIAYPKDDKAYGRENATDRAYEWLIGDAMLAAPLYGDDYETAQTRDVYLPTGEWMDFDTGKIYNGGQVLKAFALPAGKTPLFIGGSGITLEEIDGKVRVCIYPVAKNAVAKLTLPDSGEVITVRVKGSIRSAVSQSQTVKDGKGRSVETRAEKHGISFIPEAGGSYTVGVSK